MAQRVVLSGKISEDTIIELEEKLGLALEEKTIGNKSYLYSYEEDKYFDSNGKEVKVNENQFKYQNID
jgi:hypothetical protein